MKRILIYILFISWISFSNLAFSQIKTYKFDQLDSLNKINKKNVIIFIHTKWCKYCDQMMNITFKNNNIIKILNNNFYFIDFNAESMDQIKYNGHSFDFNPSGFNTGVHQLAKNLGSINGKINYPTLTILNKKNEIIFKNSGSMNSEELFGVLNEIVKN